MNTIVTVTAVNTFALTFAYRILNRYKYHKSAIASIVLLFINVIIMANPLLVNNKKLNLVCL